MNVLCAHKKHGRTIGFKDINPKMNQKHKQNVSTTEIVLFF